MPATIIAPGGGEHHRYRVQNMNYSLGTASSSLALGESASSSLVTGSPVSMATPADILSDSPESEDQQIFYPTVQIWSISGYFI